MSDRMAVFNEGRIEQIGTPAEVYEQPADRVRRRLRRRLERARARRPAVHDPPGEDPHDRRRRRRRRARRGPRGRVRRDGHALRRRPRLGRRARRRPTEPRDVVAAGARGSQASASGSTGGRSTPMRSRKEEASDTDHEGTRARCGCSPRRCACRPRASARGRRRSPTIDRQGRGHAEPDRLGGLHAAAVGQAVQEGRPAARCTRSTPARRTRW